MDDRKSAERRASNAVRDSATRAGETAREAADRLQESSSKAAEGFREYQLSVLSAAQANINAMFEYAQDALQAQSVSELMELSATHSRRHSPRLDGTGCSALPPRDSLPRRRGAGTTPGRETGYPLT